MTTSRVLYGSTIFLSAFLLFLVEPMAAKQLLPALGGSSAVWITCLVFFQTALLLGYLYAHWITQPSSSRWQNHLHLVLLVVAIAGLVAMMRFPLDLSHGSEHPVRSIFLTLTITIGLPFLLLGSTSPLLQVWLARRSQSTVQYRLFALSNFGSLLALAAYPTLIEPHLTLAFQRTLWSLGFGIYAVLCGILAWQTHSIPRSTPAPAAPTSTQTSGKRKWLWFLLPAGAAMQLCAITGHLSQNIAAIPLLWILPLTVYLLTFIIAFEKPALYRRWLIIRLLVVMLASLAYMVSKTGVSLPIGISILFFLIELFLACLFCHGEVYALRPDNPSEATLFYLLIAAGGAAGTFFIGIACPLIFSANYDVSLSFLGIAVLALAVTWQNGWPQRLLWFTGAAMLVTLTVMLHKAYTREALVEVRNFYGTLRVKQSYTPPQAHTVRTLQHGTIDHGTQWFAEGFRRTPTTYYAKDSGVGLALEHCCKGRARSVGIIGLGTGTLAAYGYAGDRFRFYEINPAVPPIAQNLFTYLHDSPAQISIAEGDARASLAREAPEGFDVLVVDAFSGDAIPLHLLTTQAMTIYRRHLAPEGILAFHVSNQYLDLVPEIAALAASTNMRARVVDTPVNELRGEYRATWVLVSNNTAFFDQPEVASMARPIPDAQKVRAWTDDYSSLLPIFQWHRQ